jgi:hypothetical protein
MQFKLNDQISTEAQIQIFWENVRNNLFLRQENWSFQNRKNQGHGRCNLLLSRNPND